MDNSPSLKSQFINEWRPKLENICSGILADWSGCPEDLRILYNELTAISRTDEDRFINRFKSTLFPLLCAEFAPKKKSKKVNDDKARLSNRQLEILTPFIGGGKISEDEAKIIRTTLQELKLWGQRLLRVKQDHGSGYLLLISLAADVKLRDRSHANKDLEDLVKRCKDSTWILLNNFCDEVLKRLVEAIHRHEKKQRIGEVGEHEEEERQGQERHVVSGFLPTNSGLKRSHSQVDEEEIDDFSSRRKLTHKGNIRDLRAIMSGSGSNNHATSLTMDSPRIQIVAPPNNLANVDDTTSTSGYRLIPQVSDHTPDSAYNEPHFLQSQFDTTLAPTPIPSPPDDLDISSGTEQTERNLTGSLYEDSTDSRLQYHENMKTYQDSSRISHASVEEEWMTHFTDFSKFINE